MNDDKKRILKMLSQGKISVDEAERLLKAIDETPVSDTSHHSSSTTDEIKKKPKYLYVKVESEGKSENGEDENEQVNIRIPLGLVRAGIKLGSIIPESVKAKVNANFSDKGIDLDLNNLKGQDIEEVLSLFSDINIDVSGGKETVKIYCE